MIYMKNIFRISGVILLILSISLTHSCKKEKPLPPVLSTTEVTAISYTTATSGGKVTNEGGDPVISRGICWGTTAEPTITNSKTTESGGLGSFISNITLLTPNTIYYVRAYATNIAGIGYGNQVSFTTSQAAVPTLTTTAITSISQTYASSGGNITSDNGGSITARGVCWSLSQSPTITDYKSEDGNGAGVFTSSITGLTKGTTYYIRAYAINSVGTGYGSILQFTTEPGIIYNPNQTYGSVTDIDGNIYKTITIGDQIWMAENLKTAKYNNGDLIGTTIPATSYIQSENMPKYQWPYGGDESHVDTYGRLYTWYSATDNRSVCPTGWHVPTDSEWISLENQLGGLSVAGGKLKEIGTEHWTVPNSGATNEMMFNALPGGYRMNTGEYDNKGSYGNFWSATSVNATVAYYRYLYYGNATMTKSFVNQKYGLSVRCLKN